MRQSFCGDFTILFLDFNPDGLPREFLGGFQRSTGAHKWVQNSTSSWARRTDQRIDYREGFLRGMSVLAWNAVPVRVGNEYVRTRAIGAIVVPCSPRP